MPKITNIKKSTNNYSNVVKLISDAYDVTFTNDELKEIEKCTPKDTNNITFNLIDGNTDLANAWRRIIIDEIEYPKLSCEMTDISSNDPKCTGLTDYIQNRIWLIPTNYVEKSDTKSKYLLDITNLTQENIIIKSDSIKYISGIKLEWNKLIDIIELMPGKFIKINISIEWGCNKEHASFNNFNSIKFRPLGYDMSEEKLPKSYLEHPTDYMLGLSCELIDPTAAVVLGWKTLLKKIENVLTELELFSKSPQLPYSTDKLKVSQMIDTSIKYEFLNETKTVANILSYYAYKLDETIAKICPYDEHPSDPSSLISIIHKDHIKLLSNAAKNIIKDCENIIKFF